MTTQQATIRKNVGIYRRKRKMSQNELGNAIGRSMGWVNKLEKGNESSVLTEDIISKIAAALNIPDDYLRDEEEHEIKDISIEEVTKSISLNTIRVANDPSSWTITLDDLNNLTTEQFDNLSFAIDIYHKAQERETHVKQKK